METTAFVAFASLVTIAALAWDNHPRVARRREEQTRARSFARPHPQFHAHRALSKEVRS